MFPADDVNALVDFSAAGIGLDAGKFRPWNAGGLQRGGYIIIGTVALDGAAAVYQKNLAAAERGNLRACLGGFTFSEEKFCGRVEDEVFHGEFILSASSIGEPWRNCLRPVRSVTPAQSRSAKR